MTRRVYTDLRTIIQTLDQHYLVVTRQELFQGANQLSERYNPISMEFKAFITRHRQLHSTFAAAGQEISELGKIQYLTTATDHDPALRDCSNMYFTAVPKLSDQRFNDLATRLINIIANRPSQGTNDFAGAVQSTTQSDIEALRREVIELQRQLRAKPQLNGVPKPKCYCWTHGSCAHSSAECNSRANGHKPEASFNNRMGGSSKRLDK